MHDLILLAARLFGVTKAEIIGPGRQRHIAEARQAAAYALRTRYQSLSLVEIGRLLGRRDHTTIIWAIKAAQSRAARDPAYARRLTQLLAAPVPATDPAPAPPTTPPAPVLVQPSGLPPLHFTLSFWGLLTARAA